MHIVHFHHLNMNGIQVSPLNKRLSMLEKQPTKIPSIDNCLLPPQCWIWIYILAASLNFSPQHFFNFKLTPPRFSWKQSHILLPNYIEPRISTWSIRNNNFLSWEFLSYFFKVINNVIMNNRTILYLYFNSLELICCSST